MPAPIQKCSTCEWWNNSPTSPDEGERKLCRRFPPDFLQHGIPNDYHGPFTAPDDWCGEWEAKKS